MSLEPNNRIKTVSLKIVSRGEVVGEIFLQLSDAKDKSSLYQVDVSGYLGKNYRGKDYFEVFQQIRTDIESKNNELIACHGSLKQFYTSGLSRSWSDGLMGYCFNEESLETEQMPVFKPVDSKDYQCLLSSDEQKDYRKKFLELNHEKLIERNLILEEEAIKREHEHGGVTSIKGFPSRDD